MFAAKYHDRVTRSAAVGARAQSPPHPEGIDNRHPGAGIEQPLDKAFRRIGLAGPRRADNRDSVIERISWQSGR
jgi:hypothetical protein